MTKSINDKDIAHVFGLSKRTFEIIWHHVFAKDKTPYSYNERDRFWDLICCEHQNPQQSTTPTTEEIKEVIGKVHCCEWSCVAKAIHEKWGGQK